MTTNETNNAFAKILLFAAIFLVAGLLTGCFDDTDVRYHTDSDAGSDVTSQDTFGDSEVHEEVSGSDAGV